MLTSTKGLEHWADILIVICYFVAVLAIGLWSIWRGDRGNVKGYFLAGRSMPWFSVGASLFSSNIGSEHFIGLAGAGAASGVALGLFEFEPSFLFLALGWLFLPVYISAGVYTLPEYLEKRFGGQRIRIYLSCFALILYIVTKLAVSIFSGSIFIQMALGWEMYTSIIVLLAITGLYTVLGGLTAVMYTDTFQTAIMMIGAAIVSGISFNKIGGISALYQKYPHSLPKIRNENTTCGLPRDDAFNMLRDPVTGDYPWPGLVLQASLGCLWYVCCDQVMVQRSLAAKNLLHAKGGSLLAACMKLLPLFLLLFPGMISRVLYPDEIACVDPNECMKYCGNPVGCSNIAYPKLVLELLPVGLRGFLMAVMMSAIMSSLTSIFNSASTLFTMDLWRRFRPQSTQRELLIVGRVFIVILCGGSILWLPVVKSSQKGMLFVYITAVEAYLGSPLGVLFLLSLLWERTTEKAAFFGLIIAHICGGIRLILELVYPAPLCGEPETRPPILYKLHFTYFGQLNLILTVIVMVGISLLTKPRDKNQLEGVTWWSKFRSDRKEKGIIEEKTHDNIVDNECDSMPVEPETCDSISTEENQGSVHKIISFICGIHANQDTPEIDIRNRRSFLHENPTTSKIINAGAIILMGVVMFFIGFFH